MEWPRWIDALRARVRAIARQRRADDELHDELSFHVAMQTQANVQRGMSQPEAARRARLRFGGVEQAKQGSRDVRPLRWADTLLQDLRYSARRLASRPTYTLLTVMTLALGAGGTAAIFSIVRAVLLNPLPVSHEEQIGVLWFGGSWTEEEFLHFRPSFPGFQRMAAHMLGDQTLEMIGEPLRIVRGLRTSAEFFDVLGTHPLIGRTFQPGDDVEGAAPVVVLSYSLWQELGADPSVVGRQFRLGGEGRTVVGVMPRGFWYPSPAIRMWTASPLNPQGRIGNWTLVGRIAEGAAVGRMQGPLAAIAEELGRRFKYAPEWDKTQAPDLTSLREFLVGNLRPSLLATLAAMGLILLIACVNAGALMLGQVSGRSSELAVRAALGAGRSRLVAQVVLESLLVGVLAGTAGAGIAAGGFGVLVRSLPLGALAEIAALDWRVFAVSMAVALLSASLVALTPAFALSRGDLQHPLTTLRTGGISSRGGRLESGLLVAQIALAVLLAAGAGLFLRTVANLRRIDTGVRVDNVAVIDGGMPAQLTQDERRRVILDTVTELQALPNIRAAAATERLPLKGSSHNLFMRVTGKPELGVFVTAFRVVTDDYFKVMGIPVRRGRGFLPTDRVSSDRVVVINEALAKKYFPGEDAIGRVVTSLPGDPGERIVGVVANVAENTLTDAAVPARYMLYEHVGFILGVPSFVISGASADDVPRLMQDARSVIQHGGGRLAIRRTLSMASVLDEAVGAPAQLATLLSLLASLALALGALGVYGMISHFVTRRTREYGIRLALGLSPARVMSQILGRGLRLVAIGGVMGVVAAVLSTRLLSSLLYGVGATDPMALGGAVLALAVAGALAAFVPAHRASRTDPALVLRQQ